MFAQTDLKQSSVCRFRGSRVLAAWIFLGLSFGPFAGAQSPTGEAAGTGDRSLASSVPLSMHEAVRLALKQNPLLFASRLEALESKQQVNVARSAFLPKSGLQLEEQMNRLNLATLIGQEAPPYSVGPYGNLQVGSTFDVPVIAVSAWKGYQAAKQRSNAAASDDQDFRERIVGLVVAQYLSVQRSKATEKAVQSRIDLAESLQKLAADALQQGTGTNTDALRASVELKVEQQNLVEAQAQTSAYGYGLAQLLGFAANQQVIATEELSSETETQPDENSSLQEALKTRPDLLAAQERQRAATFDHQSARAERLPEFHFDGYWAESGRAPGRGLPVYSYQAEMRVPIFTGGRVSAEIKESALAADRSSRLVDDRRNVVTQEVRTALTNLQAARQELQLSTDAVALSTRELKESRDRFAAGVTNNIEVITAQNSLAQSTDSQIGAMYRLQQANADLSQARGRIAEDYAK
ncbi:TolC family protein [Silvibacterium sp.]|uniref:TolC family protein n=1 Tax=Silvibacterium sp. TaxID=1964179 RepID=UPI0039E31624